MKGTRNLYRALSAALLALPTIVVFAQPQTTAPPTPAPGQVTASMYASSFVPLDSNSTFDLDGSSSFALLSTGFGGSPWFFANLNLPTGVSLDQVAFEFYSVDSTLSASGIVYQCSENPAGGDCISLQGVNVTAAPGWVYVTTVDPMGTIDNLNYSYFLAVALPDDGGETKFRRALVYYHLQVSPAPATATFPDVPTTSPFFQYVEALAASGITAGCGGGNFCPDAPVTRAQVAAFLAKALGLYWPN